MRLEYTARENDSLILLEHTLTRLPWTGLNLTNKSPVVNNLEVIDKLKNKYPGLDLCPYFSLQIQAKSTTTTPLRQLQIFCDKLVELDVQQLLLVSGNPKPKWDTVAALNNLAKFSPTIKPDIWCAFNPFLKGELLLEEQRRLELKSESGVISGVIFQLGIETDAIMSGIEFVRSRDPKLIVQGAVIAPTARLLQQFKFRPWRGVYFNQNYLGSLEQAWEQTKIVHNFYTRYQIETIMSITDLSHIDFDRVARLA